MSTPFQVVVDAANPHAVNRFWSAAMGYEMEDHHDLVRQLLDSGQITEDETIELDGRLAFKTAAASRDPDGVAPRLLFQTVPEPKTVKNRVHLDLHVGDERREAEVERLIGLGATRLWDGQQGPNRWVTMADPEGNEFCVS
jgi:hypothetical protein